MAPLSNEGLHTTKGVQSGKGVTDVGAGAGSQSRAADCHFILRPHEQDECLVVEAVARSWPPPMPFVIRQTFPLWTPDPTLSPEDLKKPEDYARRSRSSSTEPETPPPEPWTPERFVSAFILDTPRLRALIVIAANENGLKDHQAERLIEKAEALGLIHRWVVDKNRVAYATVPQPAPEAPEPVTSFDSTGGTQHITQSLATVGRYGEKTSDQLGGAIGYDGENVNGVDITVPVWNWSETHYLHFINSSAYYSLTGKVNADGFRGFQPGEVLFLGASGTRRGDGLWEITFKFAASPNRSDLAVGEITAIAKKGWEYLWVQYGDDVDENVKTRIKKPIAVYVEKVYEEGNLGSLGI